MNETFQGKSAEQWYNDWLLEYNGRLQDRREREALTAKIVEQQARETATTIMGAFVLAKPNPPPKELIAQMVAGHIQRIMAYVDTQPLNCLDGAVNIMEKCPICSALGTTKELRGFLRQFDDQLKQYPSLGPTP